MRRLESKRIYLDANAFIYFGENHPDFADPMDRLFKSAHAGFCSLVTSELTLAEVMVFPLRTLNEALADQYVCALTTTSYLTVLPIHREIILAGARMRAAYGMKLPDALHAATALETSYDISLSEDKRIHVPSDLARIRISELAQGNP